MRPLSQRQTVFRLRLEQDQGHDRWIPLEDDDAVPDKQTYDFLIFLGKDPSNEKDEFYLTTSELSDIANSRIAIELAPAKNSWLETTVKNYLGLLIWKDAAKRKFIGLKRNDRGRYSDLESGHSENAVWEKLTGFKA